jgi:hypothetical protein
MTYTDEIFNEYFPALPTVDVVVNSTNGSTTYKIPALPGVSQHVYAFFCEQVGTMASIDIDQLGHEDPEMDSRIVTSFVIARITSGTGSLGTGAPDPTRVWAERAGAATWEFTRTLLNTSERTGRHAWNQNAADHLREAHKGYVIDSWMDALPKLAGQAEAAKKAFKALRIGHPHMTAAEIVGVVLYFMPCMMEGAHPEAVPSLKPMY